MTNDEYIAEAVDSRCSGGNNHIHVVNGHSKTGEKYLPRTAAVILRALRQCMRVAGCGEAQRLLGRSWHPTRKRQFSNRKNFQIRQSQTFLRTPKNFLCTKLKKPLFYSWLVGWLVGWFGGWLVCVCVFGWLVGWLFGCFVVGCCVGCCFGDDLMFVWSRHNDQCNTQSRSLVGAKSPGSQDSRRPRHPLSPRAFTSVSARGLKKSVLKERPDGEKCLP